MKFYLVDDLHLEFSGYRMPGDPEGILLLAGDIMVAAVMDTVRTDEKSRRHRNRFENFFKEECGKYKACYYIAGNHEFYHGNWETTRDWMRVATKDTNVKVLEKELVDLGEDVVLFGATLWTDFNNDNPIVIHQARYGMNDYACIGQTVTSAMYGSSVMNLHPSTVLDEHRKTLAVLKVCLEQNKGKKIVIMTHHAPTPQSCHPRYGVNNALNWAYFSELTQFILDNPSIKFWVHGHTHDSHDYMVGPTRVLCNPRGYAYKENQVEENKKFNDKLSFEV